MELNPTAMLRTHTEKKKKSPPEGIHHVAQLSFPASLPKSFKFSLLLSAANGIFPDHHSELGSPRPSLGCTLVTSVALEPGVGPIMSRLPIWLLS